MTDEQYKGIMCALRVICFVLGIIAGTLYISGCSAHEYTHTKFDSDGEIKEQKHVGHCSLLYISDTLVAVDMKTGKLVIMRTAEPDSAAVTGLVEGVIGAGL